MTEDANEEKADETDPPEEGGDETADEPAEQDSDHREIVNVGCQGRRSCKSTEAYMNKVRPNLTRYMCTECGKTWSHRSPTSFNF